MSAAAPRMCTGTIATVASVMAASTARGSIVRLSSMSTKTGTAPSVTTALIVATHV